MLFKPAFSTVACPEWSLAQVAHAADRFGYEAVELRTFGDDSRRFACDPALTDPQKTRRLFAQYGVEILSLATSIRFDAPILPPVIGVMLSDAERSVREAKHAIDLALALECPFVRVFAFEPPPGERPASALARIVHRLQLVADNARNTGVKVVLENGGAFPRASDVLNILDRVASPLLGVSYSLAPGFAADDLPERAVAALADRLWIARIKDTRGGTPCPLGQGELPCETFVHVLADSGFSGPVVYEWDRAWLPDLAPADAILPAVPRLMADWAARSSPPSQPPGAPSPHRAGATA